MQAPVRYPALFRPHRGLTEDCLKDGAICSFSCNSICQNIISDP